MHQQTPSLSSARINVNSQSSYVSSWRDCACCTESLTPKTCLPWPTDHYKHLSPHWNGSKRPSSAKVPCTGFVTESASLTSFCPFCYDSHRGSLMISGGLTSTSDTFYGISDRWRVVTYNTEYQSKILISDQEKQISKSTPKNFTGFTCTKTLLI